MSVWDVPRTDQLPAGCSPALFHGMDVQAGRCLMVSPHDDHFGMLYVPDPAAAGTHQDRPASARGAARCKSTSKFSLYFLTQGNISAHEVMFTPKSLLIGPFGHSAPAETRSASNAGLPRLRAVPWCHGGPPPWSCGLASAKQRLLSIVSHAAHAYVSAVGFEPTRSYLQWILSPPP